LPEPPPSLPLLLSLCIISVRVLLVWIRLRANPTPPHSRRPPFSLYTLYLSINLKYHAPPLFLHRHLSQHYVCTYFGLTRYIYQYIINITLPPPSLHLRISLHYACTYFRYFTRFSPPDHVPLKRGGPALKVAIGSRRRPPPPPPPPST